jgi:hypothetical protein
MKKQPIDLSAGEVKVTAEGLRQLAEIATGRSKTDCEQSLNVVQNALFKGDFNYLEAERLAKSAESLALALRFLHGFDSLAKGERATLTLVK